MDNRKYAQALDFFLAGSGVTSTATSITLSSMLFPDGTEIVTADIGAKAYVVLEPETQREETVSFSGITQNANGTATLTGCTRGLKFNAPYTADTALRIAHAGGSKARISNPAAFYNDFANKENEETISQVWTFATAATPIITDAPVGNTDAANKAYVDGVATSGAPDANTTTKGIVQQATQAQFDARTTTGSTGAQLFAGPGVMRTVLMHDYAASSAGSDTYAITLTPAPTAYTTGDVYIFKADVANTGAATLNVNALGAKTIKKSGGAALEDNDIKAGQIVMVAYDGTDMLVLSILGNEPATRAGVQNGTYVYAASASGNDTYAITLTPAITAYANGQVFVFKPDAANTGAATLNVNAVGAKAIKKKNDQDLETGDIEANQIVMVAYDSTGDCFEMLSQTANFQDTLVFSTIVATRVGSANSEAVTYAHGLGKTPRRVFIDATTLGVSQGDISGSNGVFDTSGNHCIFTDSTTHASWLVGTSSTYTVFVQTVNGSQGGIVTVDATNITITWTEAGTGCSGTIQLVMACEA